MNMNDCREMQTNCFYLAVERMLKDNEFDALVKKHQKKERQVAQILHDKRVFQQFYELPLISKFELNSVHVSNIFWTYLWEQSLLKN